MIGSPNHFSLSVCEVANEWSEFEIGYNAVVLKNQYILNLYHKRFFLKIYFHIKITTIIKHSVNITQKYKEVYYFNPLLYFHHCLFLVFHIKNFLFVYFLVLLQKYYLTHFHQLDFHFYPQNYQN